MPVDNEKTAEGAVSAENADFAKMAYIAESVARYNRVQRYCLNCRSRVVDDTMRLKRLPRLSGRNVGNAQLAEFAGQGCCDY